MKLSLAPIWISSLRPMNLSRAVRLLLVLALMGGVVALITIPWMRNHAAEAPREYSVQKGDIEVSILATGEVRPENRLEIKPPLSGRIDEVLVQEGQQVEAGQVLVWMSSTERAALLDAARGKGEKELERWKEIYQPVPVVAPISGTIIFRMVEAGQTFDDATAIMAMSDHLLVKAQVDETDLAQIRLNQQARVTLDAYPDEPLMGRVHKISYESRIVNNVTTYSVDVLTNGTPDFMRSGMTSTVAFISDSRSDVLLVPTEAIKQVDGDSYVQLKNRSSGNLQKISIGISDGKMTEVLRGLDEGEVVLGETLAPLNESARSNPFGLGGKSPFAK